MKQTNKTALVTGAAGGLGLAIAKRLALDGGAVALVDRDATGAVAAAKEITGARGYGCDITDEPAVEDLLEQFQADFGTCPDILVNNAGIVRFGDLLDQSVEDFRQVLDVNLVGVFIMSRAVGRLMMANAGGAIVNITSLNAVAVSQDAGAYPASKAAVVKLTEQFALRLAPHGVRVNAIGPGFIDAGMSSPIYADPSVRATRGASVPAGRIGLAEDVANAVAFLSSAQADYIHGQHLMVDGGVSFSLKNQMPRKAPHSAEK
jgi:NAD(P)-dependent dehydrogenase (short-subunit alcohol dehydrogenase family)